MTPFYAWDSTTLRLLCHLEGGQFIYSLPLSSQKFLMSILKAESILEPTRGFEHGTLWLENQRLNH